MPVGMAANIVATDNQSVLRPNQEPKKNTAPGWTVFFSTVIRTAGPMEPEIE